jgi:peptide/nickel transport system ATP-binding protein
VACLLPGETRRSIWAALRSGETPDQVLQEVDIPDETLSPSADEAAAGEEVTGQ